MLSRCSACKIPFRFSISLNGVKYSRQFSTEVEVKKKVVIPPRIHRGPTDILRALAAITSRDLTAPDYKFHDDPFLIPMTQMNKRAYALSKESGKKAAKYFLENYPQLFFRDDAEPKIAAFSYKDAFDENTEVDLLDLEGCIERREVHNSITVYQNLSKQQIEVPPELQQDLLEMVCFYNNTDPADEDLTMEKWYRNPKLDKTTKNWEYGGFAEQLFESIQEKDGRAYSAMIQGLAKHAEPEKACDYYSQLKSNNLLCSVETYNSLIEVTPLTKQSGTLRWEVILSLLDDMKTMKIKPNINTFNAILEVLARSGSWSQKKSLALQTIAELTKLGLEPCLATYKHVLQIFLLPDSSLLTEIVDRLEKQNLVIKNSSDTDFFLTAMQECCQRLSDIDLAYRLHNLMQKGQNHKFIGSEWKESLYYHYFFSLHCVCETADGLMDFYNKYVPNIYIPEPSVTCRIVETIRLQEAYHYLPQLWSDIIHFEQARIFNVVQLMIDVLGDAIVEDNDLQKKFVAIIWDIVTRLKEEREANETRITPRETMTMSGELYDKCLRVVIKGKDGDKAAFIMNMLTEEQDLIPGYVSSNTLKDLAALVSESGKVNCMSQIIKYAASANDENVLSYIAENKGKWNLPEQITQDIEIVLPSESKE